MLALLQSLLAFLLKHWFEVYAFVLFVALVTWLIREMRQPDHSNEEQSY